MKLICPKCGSKIDLAHAETSADFTALINLAARFGKGWIWADEYMASFAPQAGWLKLKTKIRHLETLAVIWDEERFKKNGRRYRTDKKRIIEAMAKVCNANPSSPLKGHSYLKTVLMDTAEFEDAQGRTAQEETAREHSRRGGRDVTQDSNSPLSLEGEGRGEGGIYGAEGLEKFKAEHGGKTPAEVVTEIAKSKGIDDEI